MAKTKEAVKVSGSSKDAKKKLTGKSQKDSKDKKGSKKGEINSKTAKAKAKQAVGLQKGSKNVKQVKGIVKDKGKNSLRKSNQAKQANPSSKNKKIKKSNQPESVTASAASEDTTVATAVIAQQPQTETPEASQPNSVKESEIISEDIRDTQAAFTPVSDIESTEKEASNSETEATSNASEKSQPHAPTPAVGDEEKEKFSEVSETPSEERQKQIQPPTQSKPENAQEQQTRANDESDAYVDTKSQPIPENTSGEDKANLESVTSEKTKEEPTSKLLDIKEQPNQEDDDEEESTKPTINQLKKNTRKMRALQQTEKITQKEYEQLNDELTDLHGSVQTLKHSYGSIMNSLVALQKRRPKRNRKNQQKFGLISTPSTLNLDTANMSKQQSDEIDCYDIAHFLNPLTRDETFKILFSQIEKLQEITEKFRTCFNNHGHFLQARFDITLGKTFNRIVYNQWTTQTYRLQNIVDEIIRYYNDDLLNLFRL